MWARYRPDRVLDEIPSDRNAAPVSEFVHQRRQRIGRQDALSAELPARVRPWSETLRTRWDEEADHAFVHALTRHYAARVQIRRLGGDRRHHDGNADCDEKNASKSAHHLAAKLATRLVGQVIFGLEFTELLSERVGLERNGYGPGDCVLYVGSPIGVDVIRRLPPNGNSAPTHRFAEEIDQFRLGPLFTRHHGFSTGYPPVEYSTAGAPV